jgi:hypothetical protein
MVARAEGNRRRFATAIAAYLLLGLLVWTTLSDVPIRIAGGQIGIRGLTLAVVAFFAVRTVLHWRSEEARVAEDEVDDGE